MMETVILFFSVKVRQVTKLMMPMGQLSVVVILLVYNAGPIILFNSKVQTFILLFQISSFPEKESYGCDYIVYSV